MFKYSTAVQDFRQARSRATLKELIARLTGRSTELLSYEDVRRKVRATGVISRGLRDIPLDAIVGSVGRYNDFTRDFLPKLDSDQDRWARVKVASSELAGLPPVELYQVGEAYFVIDGHHRISVARQSGASSVEAYVTEIRSKVPLSTDITPDTLITKAEYADFLESTNLDDLRPEAKLEVTCPGRYQKLLEHIEVHRHYMGIEQQREIPYEEAVTHWYDNVYMGVVEVIRELGIMREFPGRTETDLYLWLGDHRAEIEEELGREIRTSTAAVDLADQQGSRLTRLVTNLGKRILDVAIIDELEPGPPPSLWRRERSAERREDRLFRDVLVPVNGREEGWLALEQAITVVHRESGHVQGLFVVGEEDEVQSEKAKSVQDRFFWRCGEVGLQGSFSIEVGKVSKVICTMARWSDLVIVHLSHPPQDKSLSRLGSGFRKVVRQCSRPILAVPEKVSALTRPLLAFDGSPKAKEALYVATYLTGRWQLPLDVVTVAQEDYVDEGTLDEARHYLDEHGVSADLRLVEGPVPDTLIKIATELEIDFLIMGGYGPNPVVELVAGTSVDAILRTSNIPVLICG